MTGGADAPTARDRRRGHSRLGSAIASLGTAHAATGNAVLKGSIPAWANSKNLVGTADPGGDVGFRVYLGWSNDSAVQALASAVSDPNSSSYRKFLTPAADADQWSVNRGLPQFKANQFTQIVAPGTYHHPESGKKQDPQGWYGEETLDVEAVHGMAPDANIVYVGAPNNFQDLDAALNYAVDKDVAPIITNSYGFDTEALPPGFIKPQEETIMQGVIEGIGIYFSSGDNSDESLVEGSATTDWPASSPFVTSVGGTTLGVGANNNYLFETGWGTTKSTWNGTAWSPAAPGSWIYGAGGGVSQLFAEPSYQQGVVPASVFTAQGRTGRAVPDIAAIADPNTGYLIGETQTFPDGTAKYSEYRIGGTSLASPIVAGIMALANQAAGHPLGFANPLLYSLAGSSSFRDVTNPSSTVAMVRVDYVNSVDASNGTTASLRTANQTLSLATTPGWDDVTGLGSPTAALLAALAG